MPDKITLEMARTQYPECDPSDTKLLKRRSASMFFVQCPFCMCNHWIYEKGKWRFGATPGRRWVEQKILFQARKRGSIPGACRNHAQRIGVSGNKGRYLDGLGYVKIRWGRKARREHHLVLECFYGHSIRKGESIHHRNGKRSDNWTPGNLELRFEAKHPRGISLDDMVYSLISNWSLLSEKSKGELWARFYVSQI